MPSSVAWSARRSPRVASGAVEWGGLEGWRPVGVLGVLFALAISPPLGLAFGFAAIRAQPQTVAARVAADRGPGARSGVGDVGRALVQPRRERWPEVNGRRRRAARRERSPTDVLGAALDEARVRRGADPRHDARGLADRTHDRPAHLPPDSARQLREPKRAPLRSSSLRPTSALLSRRHKWSPPRWSVSAAARRRWHHVRWAIVRSMGFAWLATLPGHGRCSGRLPFSSGERSHETASSLVPARSARRARHAARADGDHRDRDGRAGRVGERRGGRRGDGFASASTAPTSASGRCGWR